MFQVALAILKVCAFVCLCIGVRGTVWCVLVYMYNMCILTIKCYGWAHKS